MRLVFTRTMAQVEDGYGHVTYRCMACVRRELPSDKLAVLLGWLPVQTGSGMFMQTWHLVQVCQPCADCD